MRREESLGYTFNLVGRELIRALQSRLEPLGITPGQVAQLLALYQTDGLTQRELCEIVGIEQPTMANTLNRMERDGLIERRPHPSDGRKQLVYLTDKARALGSRVARAAASVNAVATAGLSNTEKSTLLDLIEKVRANLHDESGGVAETIS